MSETRIIPAQARDLFARLHGALVPIAINLRLVVEACELIAERQRMGDRISCHSGNHPENAVVIRFAEQPSAHDHIGHELRAKIQLMAQQWIPTVRDSLPVALAALDNLTMEMQIVLDGSTGESQWVARTRRVLNDLANIHGEAGFPRSVSDAVNDANLKTDLGTSLRRGAEQLEERLAQLKACIPAATAPGEGQLGKDSNPRGRMSVAEAADRLERLREQGEPYKAMSKLAALIGCSPTTVHDAIHSHPSLTAWANVGAKPRAQSINEVVLDNKAQDNELSPEDQVRIREYLERDDLTASDRSFFNAMSSERAQIDYLDGIEEQLYGDPDSDPDAVDPVTGGRGRLHARILGENPSIRERSQCYPARF